MDDEFVELVLNYNSGINSNVGNEIYFCFPNCHCHYYLFFWSTYVKQIKTKLPASLLFSSTSFPFAQTETVYDFLRASGGTGVSLFRIQIVKRYRESDSRLNVRERLTFLRRRSLYVYNSWEAGGGNREVTSVTSEEAKRQADIFLK